MAGETELLSKSLVTVNQANVTASGTLVAVPARLRSLSIVAGATAGTVVLRNGGVGGTILATYHTPAAVGIVPIPIPGLGIEFTADIYAVLTIATAVDAHWNPA